MANLFHSATWRALVAIVLITGATAHTQAAYPVDDPAPGAASQIHLSWVKDPSTSLTVTWHTSARPANALVEYRQAGSETWQREAASTKESTGQG